MAHPSLCRPCVRLAALLAIASAASGRQATFESEEEAARALVGAIEARDGRLFLTVAGPQMAVFWATDNPIRDSIERDRLVDAAHAGGVKITGEVERKSLYFGAIAEPFPAPLVRAGSGWRFDGEAGSAEVTARRIRSNETAVVELCHRLREAEFRYFQRGPRRTQAFAEKIRSAPGQQDGLFWAGQEGEESPLGPVFAAADGEQPDSEELRPLFGYYFRLLSDPNAKRAAAHFAFIAWPADYAVGGVHSFLITQSGRLFQRDLGPDGARVVATITGVHPEGNWTLLDVLPAPAAGGTRP